MNINWKHKLTSRKFWCAVAGAVVPYMMAFGYGETEVAQVTAMIMGTGTLIAYIVGEGMVDAKRSNEK